MSAKEAEIWAIAEPIQEALTALCQSLSADSNVQERIMALRGARRRDKIQIGIIDYTETDRINIETIAIDLMKARLILSEYISIGIAKSSDGKKSPQQISSEFWPGADIDLKRGIATNGDQHFSHVRIAQPSNDTDQIQPETPFAAGSHVSQVRATRKPGRPNVREKFKSEVRKVVKANPDFLVIGDRTSQAREIRARLFGEPARMRDNMHGCNIDMAKRWVGEVVTELRLK